MSDCDHDWTFEQNLFPSYPPIQRKICTKCLKLEHFHGMEYDVQSRFEEAFSRYNAQQQSNG